MSEREVFPSIFKFPTYEAALEHVAKQIHNGFEGQDIVNDPNTPPTIWHEWLHATHPELCDHDHEDTSRESFDNLMKEVTEVVKEDPQQLADALKEAIDEGRIQPSSLGGE